MPRSVVAIAFALLNAANWLGSLVAIFPLFGMLTNANGFMSGSRDALIFAFLISLPVCAVLSSVLYKLRGARLPGLVVAALPAVIGLAMLMA